MNLYGILASSIATPEAASLCARLTTWHDAMVTHERRLRLTRDGEQCDEECPHVEARVLWTEVVAVFGARAARLSFLRSRAGMHAGVTSVVSRDAALEL